MGPLDCLISEASLPPNAALARRNAWNLREGGRVGDSSL